MRAVRFHTTGGPEVLRTEEVDKPSPRANEVLVSVRAIGVNPTEVYSRTGDREHELPRIPGSDFAGVVETVGAGVDTVSPGERVFGTGLQYDRQGTYAEFVPASVTRIATLPSTVSFEEAAAAGVVGTTAWLALIEHATLTPTSTCLVHGGSGGVGHVAVQLAKLCGASVIATAGTDSLSAFAAECGADTVLGYTDADLRENVKAHSDGGVDVVLDHRVGEYLQFDLDVLARDGTVVVIGGPQDEATVTDLWPALRADVTIKVFSKSNVPDIGPVLGEIAQLLASDRLDIHTDRRYGLDEAAEAQRAVIEESFPGKLVIVP